MNPISFIALCMTLLLFGVAACSTTPTAKTPETPAEVMLYQASSAPDWVNRSCEQHWDDEDEARICSVGVVTGTKNPGLARSAAIARARAEMARSLETKVQALLKDYQASSTGGEKFAKLASDEQFITDTSKQITNTSLSGTKFENSWVAPDGTYYAMISLDLPTFEGAIQSDTSLSENERNAITERAQAAWDELNAEIDAEIARQQRQ